MRANRRQRSFDCIYDAEVVKLLHFDQWSEHNLHSSSSM
jgi:hypothetical protein